MILVMLCLQLFGLQTFAQDRVVLPRRPLEETRSRYLSNLLGHCNDGQGQACYDYGFLLTFSRRSADSSAGMAFIRRACQLAYTPACGFEKNKFARRPANAPPVGGCLSNGGLQPGDKILNINGKPFKSVPQLATALDQGSLKIELRRDGNTVPLTFSCH